MSSSSDPQPAKDPLVITSLPPELVMRIIDLTHPSAHLDLALTCKKIAHCSSAILRCHREAHAKQHTVSDLLPDSILNLLRTLVWGGKDAITAWHTRSIEIWGQRTEWQEWVPFMLEPPERFDQTAFPCKFSFDEEEMEDYMRLLQDELHLDPEVRSSCTESLRSGKDDVLKALVIALCPRLKSLKYVWTRNDAAGDSSLHRLAEAIAASKKEGCWPPGLRSLREVAVGVNSGTWLDGTPEEEVGYFPETLAELFKLPRIESIYYHCLYHGHENTVLSCPPEGMPPLNMPPPGDRTCGLTPGCSSLEHLVLHHVSGIYLYHDDYRDEGYLIDFYEALFAAPRALKSLALRGNDGREPWYDSGDVISIARERQSSSLESLMMYDIAMLHHSHSVHLQSCTNLRHVFVEDVEFTDMRWGIMIDPFTDLEKYSDDDREDTVQHAISYFPESMEVLVIGGFDAHEGAVVIETCTIRLVESKRYPKLKAIYIEDDQPRDPSETLLFQRLIEVGQRHNIDIVTASAGDRQRIHQIDFHAPPDFYDLASGPHARDRDHGEWVFNPFEGRWEPKGCGNCGDCESCFYAYTREAWATRGAAVDGAPREECVTAE